nr:putative polyprotein [Tanacetum cinerariifolium]
MVTFVVDLYHDGLFVCNPVRYLSGEHQVIKDINFEAKRDEDHTILHLSKEEENNNNLPYPKFQNCKKVAAQIIKQHEEHVFPSTLKEESTQSYQPPQDSIMGPPVYPPAQQNPQPFYRPDYQFGYPQGKDKSFSGGYDPGLWSEVISRWESITINRLNNQTWSIIGEGTIKLQPHIIKKIVNFNEEELKTKKGLRKIKEQVQNLPDLEISPENAYIILETDGCMEGWGGIVKWKKSKGDSKSSERICAYASGKFSTTQSIIDAEINACINTLEKLKIYYLDKQEVTLRTDCQAIIKCTGEMKELAAAALHSVEEVLQSSNAFQKNMKITCEEALSCSSVEPRYGSSSKINCLTCDVIFCGSSAIASREEYASGLRPICNDGQLNDFVQALYENDCHLDMYIDYQGYDVLEMINDDKQYEDKSDSDFEDVEKGNNLDDVKDIVDFQTEGRENVDIPKLSIDNPWLNNLVGKGRFVSEMEDPIPGLNGRDVSAGKCAGKRGKKQVQIDDSLDKLKGKVSEGSFDKDLGKGSARGSSDKGKRKLEKEISKPSKSGELEAPISRDEIHRAVWDCGNNIANLIKYKLRGRLLASFQDLEHKGGGTRIARRSVPGLPCMTPATSSSGLVPNTISQQPCIPPKRDDSDRLFQPMFDEYVNPPSIDVSLVQEAVASRVVVLADYLVLTSIE